MIIDQPVAEDPVCIGICRGASYGLFGAPDEIVAPARRLGARLVRIVLYWAQLEPERGQYDWTALDDFLDQLGDGDRAWITVAGSSPFGSRIATPFLPPSPATDQDGYDEFIFRMVRRAAGRVEFWQCEIEPCVGLLWSGTAAEYVTQLSIFSAAVRRARPDVSVVLGAAVPMAMVADAPGSDQRSIDRMRLITQAAAGLYDAFDVHPYGDPYLIGELVASARRMMAEAGAVKPIIAGEYAGPMPTGYRQNLPAMAPVLAAYRQNFAEGRLEGNGLGPEVDLPEMITLYEDRERLPDTLQMFLQDGDPELRRRRDRAVARELIIRTALLAAAGVRLAVPFQLAPERRGENPRTVRALMFGAFPLHDYPDDEPGSSDPADWIRSPRPAAATFALLADVFAGATSVRRVDRADGELFMIEIGHRGDKTSDLLIWRRSGAVSEIELPDLGPDRVDVIDIHGARMTFSAAGPARRLPVGSTPILIHPRKSSRQPSDPEESPSWTAAS